MAIISCPECQGKVSDRAPACPHCGNPLQVGRSGDKRQQYESCRIEWGSTAGKISRAFAAGGDPLYGKNCFWADATCPVNGSYSAGCSPLFVPGFFHGLGQFFSGRMGLRDWDNRPPANDEATLQAHRALIDVLVKDGWEPRNIRGSQWWQHSFRRPVRSEDEWVAFVLEPRWNGLWYREGPVSEEQKTDFQEGIASGQIRNERGDFWIRRDWLIENIGSMGAEVSSEIKVGPDGTTRITFHRTGKVTLDYEVGLYKSIEDESVDKKIPAGTVFTILQESENWVRVRIPSGEEGFLVRKGASEAAEEDSAAQAGATTARRVLTPVRNRYTGELQCPAPCHWTNPKGSTSCAKCGAAFGQPN